jgi:Protein of unknown function (DUF3375)
MSRRKNYSVPAFAFQRYGITAGSQTSDVYYDWLEAGEHIQRMVTQLSQRVRRNLDDQADVEAWLENRRNMRLLHEIETDALNVRKMPSECIPVILSRFRRPTSRTSVCPAIFSGPFGVLISVSPSSLVEFMSVATP